MPFYSEPSLHALRWILTCLVVKYGGKCEWVRDNVFRVSYIFLPSTMSRTDSSLFLNPVSLKVGLIALQMYGPADFSNPQKICCCFESIKIQYSCCNYPTNSLSLQRQCQSVAGEPNMYQQASSSYCSCQEEKDEKQTSPIPSPMGLNQLG